MMKFLLLIAVLSIIVWLLARHRKQPPSNKVDPETTEKIVVCAHCRIHVPESESIESDGRHYCCDEHRKLGAT